MAIAVGGICAAYAVGRFVDGPVAGVGGAALLTVTAPYPTVAPTVAADVPAVALGLTAIAFAAVGFRRGRSDLFALATGIFAGLALAVKLLALPLIVPVIVYACLNRPGPRKLLVAAAGAIAVAGVVLVAARNSLPALWRETVVHHATNDTGPTRFMNAHRMLHYLDLRTPSGWLIAAGLIATVAVPGARRAWPLWTAAVAAAVFLIALRPLYDHHFALLAAASAVPAGIALAKAVQELSGRTQWALSCFLALAVAAGVAQEHRRLVRNDVAEPEQLRWAARVVDAASPPSELVVSDQPVVGFLANRRLAGQLIDTSSARVESGNLTASKVMHAIERSRARVVVIDRMLGTLPAVVRKLRAYYPVHLGCGGATIFLRERPRLATPCTRKASS